MRKTKEYVPNEGTRIHLSSKKKEKPNEMEISSLPDKEFKESHLNAHQTRVEDKNSGRTSKS